MNKVEQIILKIMGWFLAVLMFVMMCDIFASVLVRYVFHTALNFAEELGRYTFVWIVFIGMARCVADNKHVALDILPNALKGGVGKGLHALIDLICIVFFVAVTMSGFAMCQIGARQKSATMRIPMNYVYMCIPICGVLSILFLILKLYRLFKKEEKPV